MAEDGGGEGAILSLESASFVAPNQSKSDDAERFHIYAQNVSQIRSPTQIKSSKIQSACASCFGQFADRFLLRIGKFLYHETCARCAKCGLRVDDAAADCDARCFVERDGRLFCWSHGTR